MKALRTVCFTVVAFVALGLGASAATEMPDVHSYDLATYRGMEKESPEQLSMISGAMYEAVFYARGSLGGTTVCATPLPLGKQLRDLIADEVSHPTTHMDRPYTGADSAAFVLVNA